MSQLFGRATIRAGGLSLKTAAKSSTLDIGGVTRTPKPGDNDADGYTEELGPSKVECAVQMRAGVSLAAIHAMTNVTVTFECDTGQVYLINHGYSSTPPTLDAEGNAKCVFMGAPAEEML